MTVDIEKAFDSINHCFLIKVLEKYGFEKDFIKWIKILLQNQEWRRSVVVITTAQLHSTKPERKFCAGSNPTRGGLKIHDGEDHLWQRSRLEINLNALCRSTIPQKQFIIIIIIMHRKRRNYNKLL